MWRDDLFYGLICLFGISAVPVYGTWLLSRNVSKLNKPCNLFMWTIKRCCVVIVTICLPATILVMSSDRQSGEALKEQEVNLANRYLIFQVISALKFIILGILPWMITCTTLTYNVRRLSYKIVSLQIFFIITVTFSLSIGIVSSSSGSIGELVLVSLYCHLCTITPVTLIVWNTFRRWRQQTHSIRTRTPIYSSTCIACLWVLVMCTFLPADFILIGHLLVKQGFITNTIHNSSSEPNLLLSENLKYISDFVKYIFVGLFPVFLLTSKQFRGILAIAAHRKWQNLVKHIGKFLKAETDKRCSVISVTSTGGPQRSFSVVINEHHLCLHSSVVHDHCPRSTQSAPAEDPNRARENFQLAVELPMKVHYHPTIRNDERKISESSEDLAAIDIQSLKIDLHQLHTSYDEFCQSCVREKFVKDSKRKKVVKLRPGKLIHDEGKKIKVGAEKDKSLKYQVEGKSFKVNKKAGADAPNTVDIRETVTSLGENQLDVQSYQTEKSISSVGSLLALVE
ncbi:hypothetical protein ACHWQZ_G003212 [Mnemiopsis leidyi]